MTFYRAAGGAAKSRGAARLGRGSVAGMGGGVLDSTVRGEPEDGETDVDGLGDPRGEEGGGDGGGVADDGSFPLAVVGEDFFQGGVGAVGGEDLLLEDSVGESGQEENGAVEGGGGGGEVIFAHPVG